MKDPEDDIDAITPMLPLAVTRRKTLGKIRRLNRRLRFLMHVFTRLFSEVQRWNVDSLRFFTTERARLCASPSSL